METRRHFIKGILSCLGFVGLLFSPFSALVGSALSQAKKIILPKETERESLVTKNPADLDTRNLEITPLQDFQTMGPTEHKVDLDTWRLEVKGHVKTPLDLPYKQITSLPSVERDVLLICPGVFANHGRWKGISMGALLKTVKTEEGVTHVTVRGPRGASEKVERFTIQEILSNKVFLAYQVNGQILPPRHGFPLRVVAEDHYGYEWVKYVDQITIEKI
ncbi:MAG: molybdopterin-dependent oxidoreductase [Desulfobacteraceae bacterium]|jgi:sulfoxide reductase catalytic subunit YedY